MPDPTTFSFLVISDSFGKMVRDALIVHQQEIAGCHAMLLLGDLPAKAYPALRAEFGLKMPGFCVLGNHDHTDWEGWLPRYKFQHLHQKIASLRITGKEITLGGFSGAEVYAPGDDWHWTDEDAHHAIQQLPACDILLTHTAGSPPPDYPPDRHHRGLPPIARYINTHQPSVALHGHFHHNYHLQTGRTQTVGCYGAVLLRCTITGQTWQVEAKPINQNPW